MSSEPTWASVLVPGRHWEGTIPGFRSCEHQVSGVWIGCPPPRSRPPSNFLGEPLMGSSRA